MNKHLQLSLSTDDLKSGRYMNGRLRRNSLIASKKFKELVEKGCALVHLPSKQDGKVSISPYRADKLLKVDLPSKEIQSATILSMQQRNGGNEDTQKLVVRSASFNGGDNDSLSLCVGALSISELLAIKEWNYEKAKYERIHRLDTHVHLIAREKPHTYLLVTKRNGWLLPVLSNTMDANVPGMQDEIWKVDALRKLGEPEAKVEYLGAMVDAKHIGAFGIIGLIDSGLNPPAVSARFDKAGFKLEALEAVILERANFSKWMRENAGKMTSQMITASAVLAFRMWGDEFFLQADS